MMDARRQLIVLLGGAAGAAQVRRTLVSDWVPCVVAGGQIAGLRRWLSRGRDELDIVACVTLDPPTVRQRGLALATLLADWNHRDGGLRSVGVLVDGTTLAEAAAIGCDLYVNGSHEARRAIRLLGAGRLDWSRPFRAGQDDLPAVAGHAGPRFGATPHRARRPRVGAGAAPWPTGQRWALGAGDPGSGLAFRGNAPDDMTVGEPDGGTTFEGWRIGPERACGDPDGSG